MVRHLAVVLAGVTAVVILVSAIAAGPVAAAGRNGSQRVTDSKDGFSLVLPSTWTQVSLSGSDIGAIIGSASKVASLNQTALSDAEGAAKQGLKFFALSSQSEDGGAFDPNVNVGVYQGTTSTSLLDAQIKLQLAELGAKQVATRKVHFPIGTVIEGSYSVPSQSIGKLYGTQVYAMHNGRTYIITFSTADPSYLAETVATIMPTWRFTSG